MVDFQLSSLLIPWTAGLFVLLLILLKMYRPTTELLPLPPGPLPFPVVGNSLNMPTVQPWKVFKEWSQIYGDVMYLHLPAQPTIVLNTVKSATDLLERRSGLYSSRPYSVMVDLLYWSFSFGFQPYGQGWRTRRKYFHEHFHQGVVRKYTPVQTQEVRSFLRRVLASPEKLEQYIRLAFVAMIVNIIYGVQIDDVNADYVIVSQKALEGVIYAGVPGKFWVEYLPILRFIPSWVPGATFKQFTEYYKPAVRQMVQWPFKIVKDALDDDTAPPSVARALITQIQEKYGGTSAFTEHEQMVMESIGAAYGAAADTTNSAAMCFVLAMALYPDVQKKAQAELDLHVGSKRLPNIEDYSSLPYIRAITLECMRWHAAVPLGLPHHLIVDDEYNGYRIPKGTTVIPNAWAMLRDPDAYPEPETFNPDRFLKDGQLNPEVQDPLTIAFGFGRRICPGRHLSNNALFIFAASVLHVYNIEPATDSAGNPIPVEVNMTTGIVSHPEAVPCVLKPRSPAAERLILESEQAIPL